MMLRMKSTVDSCCAVDAYAETDLISSVPGSALMPTPGSSRLTTTNAITSASGVVTISKYTRVLMPMRPRSLMSPIVAMPATTVVKITGAMIILISLMKPSPRGFMAAPRSGRRAASNTPVVMPTST